MDYYYSKCRGKHAYERNLNKSKLYVFMSLGLSPFPSLPPLNLSGMTPLPSEFLAQFPLVTEVSTPPTELLSSAAQISSLSANPVPSASAEQASTFIVESTLTPVPSTPAFKIPSVPEDRGDGSATNHEKPPSSITDASATESS